MIIYPAIDLKGGRCVRLIQGDMDKATIYGADPAVVARSFEQRGAKWIHVVDLDGAFAGNSINIDAISAILDTVNIPLQLGGGIRSFEQLDRLLDGLGIERAILGTAAIQNQVFLQQAIMKYGERIAVGIDAREGRVAVKGWAEETTVTPLMLARKVKDLGVKTIIYTDISRDGMLTGPNIAATSQLILDTGMDIIVSGGVANINDIEQSRAINAAGVIVGKALYAGAVSLEMAIKAGGEQC